MAPGCGYESGIRRKQPGGAHGGWRSSRSSACIIMYDALEFYACASGKRVPLKRIDPETMAKLSLEIFNVLR